MRSNVGGERWYKGDHVEGGYAALERSGRSRDEVLTASAGYSEADEPQVLVLGYGHLEILSGDGDLLLNIGDRDVRAVRLAEGRGVQVCIGQASGSALGPTRWLHRVSDPDARYLEQCWLDSPRFMQPGMQLNPLPWRDEEYAYYVGRVVAEASRCDAALAGLVLSARALVGKPPGKIHGASGKILADALDEFAELSPAFADLGERYRAWYSQRNFATHGIRGRDAAGRPTGRVFKATRGRAGQPPDVAFEVRDQDFRELALLWRAFYALQLDALEATIHITGTGTPEEILAQMPTPNSVSASDRLPSNVPTVGSADISSSPGVLGPPCASSRRNADRTIRGLSGIL
jgi:hypothetical protein